MLVGLKLRGRRTAAKSSDGRARAAAANSAALQPLVLDDVGGGLAALYGVVVGHDNRAERIAEGGIGDVDRRHGCA